MGKPGSGKNLKAQLEQRRVQKLTEAAAKQARLMAEQAEKRKALVRSGRLKRQR